MAKTNKNYIEENENKPSLWRYFIPKILAVVTGKDRYLPKIEWVDDLWTHNIFRAYEWLCFRRLGMRPEVSMSTFVNEKGEQITVRQFHTLEAVMVYTEETIREILKRLLNPREWNWFDELAQVFQTFKVFIPKTANGFQMPSESPYLFAIAYVGTSTIQDSSSTTSLSVAFSTSGSDRLLVGGVKAYRNPDNTGTLSTFTYNSTNLTAVGSGAQTANQNNGRIYMSYLIAPTTGSNTLACSFASSGTNGTMVATQYSGAKQSGQPDSSNQGSGGASSLTASTTVVANDSWLVGIMISMAGASSVVAGTGTTERASAGSPDFFMGDSNGAKATGSQSMGFTMNNDNYGYIIASFAQGATDISVSATVLTFTSSTPAPAIAGGATVSQGTPPVATFTTPAPAISGASNVTASVLTAVFSTPAVNIITPDSQTDANVLTANFTIPAPVVQIDTTVSVGVQTIVSSIPASSVQIDVSVAVSPQVATFSTPAPTIIEESNISVSASVLTVTFSIPAPTVTAEQNAVAEPSTLTATFTTPEVTVTAERHVSVDASVVSATFSINQPTKVGGLWTAQPRNLGVWTPQGRAI